MSYKKFRNVYHIGAKYINERDENGWTPLHHASAEGSLDDVHHLICLGANKNIKNLKGETPLILAVEREHDISLIRLLMGCVSNSYFYGEDETSWTILHYASFVGLDVETVQMLVERRKSMINSKTSTGKTALMLAATNTRSFLTELLLRSGADVNCCDDDGCTAMHYAAAEGQFETVWHLLRFGGDVSVRNKKRETPKGLAFKHRHLGIFDLLTDCEKCRQDTDEKEILNAMLLYSSGAGLMTQVQSLLNDGADIDSKRECLGDTALLRAARFNCKKIVELLINLGADINVSNDDGLTVLHFAVRHEWADIVHCLVAKGADIELKCKFGKTPLIMAVENCRRTNMVELLVDLGADTKACSGYGWNLLHYAAKINNSAMVRFLVSIGADLDSVSLRGETPLLIAAQASNLAVVELLMELGANIDSYRQRTTLLHCACCNGWMEIVKSLLHKGADIDCRMPPDFSTPLITAISMEKFELVHYLLQEGANCNVRDCSGATAMNTLLKSKVRDIAMIKILIKNGAYVNYHANDILVSRLMTQVYIFKDIKLCSQVIINNFNYKDLPFFYKKIGSTNRLPTIEKLEISKDSQVVLQVEQDVVRDIKVRGYCDVLKMRPLVLRILAVKSLLRYGFRVKKSSVKNVSCIT